MQGQCTAPPLTRERLAHGLNHSNHAIRSFAKIVTEARKTKTIPNKQDIPTMELILMTERELGPLTGEDHESAFHIIWYLKELSLGRHPQ